MFDYRSVLNTLTELMNHPKRTFIYIAAFVLLSYYLIVIRFEIKSLNDFLDTVAMLISGAFLIALKAALELPLKLTIATIEVVMQKIAGSTQYIISHVKLPKIDLPFIHV